jgi:hypothetical protein
MPVKHSNENQSRLKADFFNTIDPERPFHPSVIVP